MVDYSKWDKLAVSSSSEDDDPANVSTLEDYSREACFCNDCANERLPPSKMNSPPLPNGAASSSESMSEQLASHTQSLGLDVDGNLNSDCSARVPCTRAQGRDSTSSGTGLTSGDNDRGRNDTNGSSPRSNSASSHPVHLHPKTASRRSSATHSSTSTGGSAEASSGKTSRTANSHHTGCGGSAVPAVASRTGASAANAMGALPSKNAKKSTAAHMGVPGGAGASSAAGGSSGHASTLHAMHNGGSGARSLKGAVGVDDNGSKLPPSSSGAASAAAAAFSAFSSSLTTQRAAQPADIFGPPPSTRKNNSSMNHHSHTNPSPPPPPSAPTFPPPPPASSGGGGAASSAGGVVSAAVSSSASSRAGQPKTASTGPSRSHGTSGKMVTSTGRRTKFVQLVENDDGEGLPDVFLEHPSEHVPRVDGVDGRMHGWGISVSRDHHHDFARKMRQMKAHAMYNSRSGVLLPELQFVRELIVQKKREIVAARLSAQVHALARSDYVLRVSLCDVVPELFRVVKVSGDIALFALQDKVLSPVMGWTRNIHAYVFISQQDGAVYGPQDASFEDLSRMDSFGWESIDDTRVRLCDVLTAPHQAMHYVYDLEEGWWHRITVQEIRAPSESTGEVVVLEGAMACPPEEALGIGLVGAKGSLGFATALASGAIDCVEAGQAWNVHREMFDPYDFSLEEVDARLSEALAVPASVQYGSKRVFYRDDHDLGTMVNSSNGDHHAIHDNEQMHESSRPADLQEGWETQVLGRRKGHVLWTGPLWKCSPSGDGCGCRGAASGAVCRAPMVSEVLSKTRDPKRIALCNWCGNPNDLSVCGGCRRVRYCSRDCQEDSWRAGHRFQCDVAVPNVRSKPITSSTAASGASASGPEATKSNDMTHAQNHAYSSSAPAKAGSVHPKRAVDPETNGPTEAGAGTG